MYRPFVGSLGTPTPHIRPNSTASSTHTCSALVVVAILLGASMLCYRSPSRAHLHTAECTSDNLYLALSATSAAEAHKEKGYAGDAASTATRIELDAVAVQQTTRYLPTLLAAGAQAFCLAAVMPLYLTTLSSTLALTSHVVGALLALQAFLACGFQLLLVPRLLAYVGTRTVVRCQMALLPVGLLGVATLPQLGSFCPVPTFLLLAIILALQSTAFGASNLLADEVPR